MRKIALAVLFALVLSGMVGAGDASRCECKCVCAEEKRTEVWKTVVGTGRTASQLVAHIEVNGRNVSGWAKDLMSTPHFTFCDKDKIYRLVLIRGDEFTDGERITRNILAKAKELGYGKPPAEVAVLLREQFTQEELGHPYVVVMHESIGGSRGLLRVLVLSRFDDEEWLDGWHARPERRWGRGCVFVFLAPEN